VDGKTRIELARDCEAVDFERFVGQLGLHSRRSGTIVEIFDASDVVGSAVTSWLAESHEPLVPSPLEGGALSLRPPAA
jgi:hypothetical protein